MSVLDVAILILATWRLSSLLANEDGPGGVLEGLRQRLGVRYGPDGERYAVTLWANEALCQWCNSIWIGAALAALYWRWPGGTVLACLPLALSTGTILITTSKGLQVFLRRLGEK